MSVKLQKHTDTGWELYSGGKIKARLYNGFATIIFDNFTFTGIVGSDIILFTLPAKYIPKTSIYFNLHLNDKTPIPFAAWVSVDGVIKAWAIYSTNNVVGTVTYPI